MEKKWEYIIWFSLITFITIGCTKPYAPKVTTAPTNYLVVEGIINTGANDSTVIILSRTTPITSAQGIVPERNAVVTIQDNTGASYSLPETDTGVYTSANLTLDNTKQYRLNITTAGNKNYVTDYLTPEVTPPIDSIGYTLGNGGVQIYANTHDPNNSTHYYRWDYNETWVFKAKYHSSFVTNGSAIVMRTPQQQIYFCYGNDISTNIVLGSSAKLTQDVIYQSPITFMLATSEKLEERYSILVKQYAMTSAGYTYFNLLKQNTEELGGIFDPQPTSLTGNIHCTTNPAIPAIGYITAGTVQQKRIYINSTDLPYSPTLYPYDCEQDTAKQDEFPYLIFNPGVIISQGIYAPGPPGPPIAYLYTDRQCADCTIRGSVTPPSFWVPGIYH